MQPTNNTARVAGAVYFLLFPAPLSLIYIPNKIIVAGNAAATANNIRTHEMLFRIGILNELYIAVVWIVLAMVLYRLLNGVNRMHAALMVLGAVVSAPISFLDVLPELAALTLLRGASFLSVFDSRQREALALFFLGLHNQGFVVNQVLWGLWLFPFGLLVMRSGFLPRILGILLIINCFAYVAASLTSLLLPAYSSAVAQATMPALTGELWIGLWLLIKGARVQPPRVAAAARA